MLGVPAMHQASTFAWRCARLVTHAKEATAGGSQPRAQVVTPENRFRPVDERPQLRRLPSLILRFGVSLSVKVVLQAVRAYAFREPLSKMVMTGGAV